MYRRDFLKYLLATPVAAQLDVEKLLWVPGEKTIFLPTTQEAVFDWRITQMMFGIPYHYTDATVGTWLGFTRLK